MKFTLTPAGPSFSLAPGGLGPIVTLSSDAFGEPSILAFAPVVTSTQPTDMVLIQRGGQLQKIPAPDFSGIAGPAGRGIAGVGQPLGLSSMVIDFSDATTETIELPAGLPGPQSTVPGPASTVAGPAGRGITTISGSGSQAQVSLTDGSTMYFALPASTVPGPASTVPGPASTVPGPASTVAGPAGRGITTISGSGSQAQVSLTDGSTMYFALPASTVPGPASTVPGPASTVPGPASTVAGPAGRGITTISGSGSQAQVSLTDGSTMYFALPASTVPGPASTVPGPASTVPGPASTVAGPAGRGITTISGSGSQAQVSLTDGSTMYFALPASTVPGPASTVPGPASTVPGPAGRGITTISGSGSQAQVSLTDGSTMYFALPASTVPGPASTVPGPASTVPGPGSNPDGIYLKLIGQAGNQQTTANIIPPAGSGVAANGLPDAGFTQPWNGDLRNSLLSATVYNPATGISALSSMHADWLVRIGAALYVDSFEHGGGPGAIANTFLDANSMADAVSTKRIAAGVGAVNCLAVVNAAIGYCHTNNLWLIFTPRQYVTASPLLIPDPVLGQRVKWMWQSGAELMGGYDTSSSVNGYVANNTHRNLAYKTQQPQIIGLRIRQKFTCAVHFLLGTVIGEEDWFATTSGDCTGLTHPVNGNPVSATNMCQWQASATMLSQAGSFTGSISGTTLTVTAIAYNGVQIGQQLGGSSGPMAARNWLVTGYGSGVTGGTGAYTVAWIGSGNAPGNVAAQTWYGFPTYAFFDVAPPISTSSPLWTSTATSTQMGIHHLFFLCQGTTPAGPPTKMTIGSWTGWVLPINLPNTNTSLTFVKNSGIPASSSNVVFVRDMVGAMPAAFPIASSSTSPSIGETFAQGAPSFTFFCGNNARGQGPTPAFWQGTGFDVGADSGMFVDCATIGISNGQGRRWFGDNNTTIRLRVLCPDPRNSCGGSMQIAGNGNRGYDNEFHGGDDAIEWVSGGLKNGSSNVSGQYDMNDNWEIRPRAISFNARAVVCGLGAGSVSALHASVTSSTSAPAMAPNSNTLYFDEGGLTAPLIAQIQASVAAASAGASGTNASNLLGVFNKFYVRSGSAYVSSYADNQTIGSWTGAVVGLTDPTQTYAITGKQAIPPGTGVTFALGNNGTANNANALRNGVIGGKLWSGNASGVTTGNQGTVGETQMHVFDSTLDMSLAQFTRAYYYSGQGVTGFILNGGFAGGVQLLLRNVDLVGAITQGMFGNGYVNRLDIDTCSFPPPVSCLNPALPTIQISGLGRARIYNSEIWASLGQPALQAGQAADTTDNYGDFIPQAAANVDVLGNKFFGCQDAQVAVQILRCADFNALFNEYEQATGLGAGSAQAISYDTTSTGGLIDCENWTGLDGLSPIAAGVGTTNTNAIVGFNNKQNLAPNPANGPFAPFVPVPSPAMAAAIAAAIPAAIAALPRETPTNPLQQGVAMIEAGGAVVVAGA